MMRPDIRIARGIVRAGFLISSPMIGANSRPANPNVIVAKKASVPNCLKLGTNDAPSNEVTLPKRSQT
ncbi:MAG: hypothetical protein P8Y29_10605 [Gemmatimonadota bacterium]